MSKAKKTTDTTHERSFGAVLADIRELQERFAVIRHYLSMSEHIFEAAQEGDAATLATFVEKVRPAFEEAKRAAGGE